jgi:hypothetical protein
MKSKQILIVTRFFHPEITPRAFRAFELAKEFSRQGHKVTVLTTKKDYNYGQVQQKYGFTVKATVTKEPRDLQGGGLIRVVRFALLHFFQYPFIRLTPFFKKALSLENGYDLLISVAYPYPVHFGVALAKAKNKTLTQTWIADCGDPFAGNQHGRLPYPFYYKWVENWFCKHVDYITIPIEGAKKAYPKKYHHKIRVIPQGFDFTEITPNYSESKNVIPTFAYAGNLSPGLRDPRPLLEFLITIDRAFKFVIYTKNKSFLKPYKDQLKDKLQVKDFVPRKVLLKELGQMDFLLNLENKGTTQQPSKLIDYALLERPILSINPFDVDENKILDFLNANYDRALAIKNIEQYNIVNVVMDFLEIFEE